MSVHEVADAMMSIEHMIPRRVPYEEIIARLDDVASMPGAERLMPQRLSLRILVMTIYERGEDEVDEVLREFDRVARPVLESTTTPCATTTRYRADTVVATCATFKGLRDKYLPRTIKEIEQEMADLTSSLKAARRLLREVLEP